MAKSTPSQSSSGSSRRKAYRVVVSGQFVTRDKTFKQFEKEAFILPEIVTYVSGVKWGHKEVGGKRTRVPVPDVRRANALVANSGPAKVVLKAYYLPPCLREKYPDFHRLHKFEIFSQERILVESEKLRDVGEVNIIDMTESELLQYCAISGITEINLEAYGSLPDKRIAVQRYLDNQRRQESLERARADYDPLLEEPAYIKNSDEVVDSLDEWVQDKGDRDRSIFSNTEMA